MHIWKHPFLWLTFAKFGPGDEPVYYECFPGQLESFYQGVSGSIYTVEGSFEAPPGVGIRCAAVSEQAVGVKDCEHVPDVREALLEYQAKGTLRILRFEQLPQKKHEANREMIQSAIRRLSLLEETSPMAEFVKRTFPDEWEIASRLPAPGSEGSL